MLDEWYWTQEQVQQHPRSGLEAKTVLIYHQFDFSELVDRLQLIYREQVGGNDNTR